MKPAVYEPRGVWQSGAVQYPDAAAVKDDFEPFLRHHIVPVVGKDFPAPMEELDFEVRLPGGAKVAAHGRIISLRDGSALIRVDGWSEADLAALLAATTVATPAPAPVAAPAPAASSVRAVPAAPASSARALPLAPASSARAVPVAPPSTSRAVPVAPPSRDGAPRAQTPAPAAPRAQMPAPAPASAAPRAQTPAPAAPRAAPAPSASRDQAPTPVFGLPHDGPEPRASLVDPPKRRERESVRLTTPKIDDFLVSSLRAASRGSQTGIPVVGSGAAPRAGLRGSQQATPAAREDLTGALRAASRDAESAAPTAPPPPLDPSHAPPDVAAASPPPRLTGRIPTTPDTSHVRPVALPLSNRVTTHGMAAVRPTASSPPRTTTDPGFAAVSREDEARALYEARAKGNLFDALGLHFTDAPSRLRAAHQAILAEYRVGAPAHRKSPTYADLLVKLANQAWTVLSDKGSRRRYRREILSVDVDSAAQILASKSKFAMSRGDLAAARELLEAAADLHPDPEYVDELRNLLTGKLPPPETEDTVELVRPAPRTRTPTR